MRTVFKNSSLVNWCGYLLLCVWYYTLLDRMHSDFRKSSTNTSHAGVTANRMIYLCHRQKWRRQTHSNSYFDRPLCSKRLHGTVTTRVCVRVCAPCQIQYTYADRLVTHLWARKRARSVFALFPENTHSHMLRADFGGIVLLLAMETNRVALRRCRFY